MSTDTEKELINRLCNEIQLFDLCDLESCHFRNGKFCTDQNLLAKFEAISEEDDRPEVVDADAELDENDDFIDDYDEMDEED